jgi:hypothetical protein
MVPPVREARATGALKTWGFSGVRETADLWARSTDIEV